VASSCTVPRKYQVNKPFVFQTNIDVRGNIKLAERLDMETRLFNQLDDSLKTKTISFAGIRKTLISPAVFDSVYATRSITYMNSLMTSLGYYKPTITWDSTLKVVGKQKRVTINFLVVPGKNLKLDSIDFVLTDSSLQHLAIESRPGSLLKKGAPYSQQIVAAELDRLIDVYKDHGYLKISKEDLYAEQDTVVAGLINPGLDPFEEIALLEELRQRRENPTINVVIKQRTKNPTHIQQYTINKVSIYPTLKLLEDTTLSVFDSTTINRITIFSKENKFKPAFLARNTSLIPGNMYRLSDYYKTNNTFSQLGAWQQVNIELSPDDSTATVDARINLYPAKKQNLLIDLEATRNSGDVIATSNLFGVGFNIGLLNRNLAKESIQSTTNVRAGIELGSKTRLIQTLQGSFGKTIYVSKILPPLRKFFEGKKLSSSRTLFNFNTSYTDRRDFFTLGSINGSVGYEFAKKIDKKSPNQSSVRGWYLSLFNIELVRLGIGYRLDTLFKIIPNLRFSFNNGLIIGQYAVYQSIKTNKNKTTSLKGRIEQSGALTGLLKSIDQQAGLYRYIKVDIDYRHLIALNKTAWAFRGYAGLGVPYGKQNGGAKETSLPFFKSFFAGGPNSMRGWQVRRLGQGSTKFYSLNDTTKEYDRFGDIALEGNAEFRFNVATIASVKVKSALFTDVGNIWNRSINGNSELKGTDFQLSRLYNDLAVDAGTSLRFDFNYFLVRFDWAYRLKDPSLSELNYGWFQNLKIGNGQFQLGINYPF
jgi:outer membrane protein assembly factor BamA